MHSAQENENTATWAWYVMLAVVAIPFFSIGAPPLTLHVCVCVRQILSMAICRVRPMRTHEPLSRGLASPHLVLLAFPASHYVQQSVAWIALAKYVIASLIPLATQVGRG